MLKGVCLIYVLQAEICHFLKSELYFKFAGNLLFLRKLYIFSKLKENSVIFINLEIF